MTPHTPYQSYTVSGIAITLVACGLSKPNEIKSISRERFVQIIYAFSLSLHILSFLVFCLFFSLLSLFSLFSPSFLPSHSSPSFLHLIFFLPPQLIFCQPPFYLLCPPLHLLPSSSPFSFHHIIPFFSCVCVCVYLSVCLSVCSRPPLARLGGFVFYLLVSVNICRTVRTYDYSTSSTIKLSLPGADQVDAQRRK